MLELAAKLLAMAAEEQEKAEQAAKAGTALAMGDRDRHIARAAAFLDASELAMESIK